MIGTALNPDAGRDPAEELAEQVELCLERPFNPVNQMDRIDWAVAINSEMPWHLRDVVERAAIILEGRYWKGVR